MRRSQQLRRQFKTTLLQPTHIMHRNVSRFITFPNHVPSLTTRTDVYKFSSVPDFFEDYAKIAESSPDGKASTQPALGILKRDYGGPNTDPELNEEAGQQWIRFASYITHLNKQHPNDGISYKLMYVIRHGRGVHNVKMDELKLSEEAGQLETYDGKPKNWKVRLQFSLHYS